jgi:hypothetical protein
MGQALESMFEQGIISSEESGRLQIKSTTDFAPATMAAIETATF